MKESTEKKPAKEDAVEATAPQSATPETATPEVAQAPKPQQAKAPLIKTVSEVYLMTDEERERFKRAGGTTVSDPE